MTPPAVKADPTLAQLFQHILERDESFRDLHSQTTARISDQNTAIQGLQTELSRLVKLAEKQDGYNERQIQLAEKTAEHAKTFDRAFGEIEKHKSELSKSIDSLALELGTFGKSVTGYQAAITAVRWVLGITLPLMLALIALVYSNLIGKIDAAETALRVEATRQGEQQRDNDARLDALEAR